MSIYVHIFGKKQKELNICSSYYITADEEKAKKTKMRLLHNLQHS